MEIFFEYLILSIYFSSALALLLYGLNSYIMIFLFKKNANRQKIVRQEVLHDFSKTNDMENLPFVTTQIPVFNEYNVAQRVIQAASMIKYPKDRHEIQVLDDSTDETVILIDETIKMLKAQGHDIRVIRRNNRTGFKAGALSHGLSLAKGEYISIFDADFIPPEYYLYQTIPFFLKDNSVGLVQARWGHINRDYSLLTKAQSIGIDGHFMVEQSARNWGGLFMNFNGTAGIFRKKAILDVGGWNWDTLTEDLDLSYRIQFAGWKTVYNPDLVVPAEIPEDMSAFKSQQFRWAKGSIQTAKKLFWDIIKSQSSFFRKVQAFFHLTHYMVHLLMVILAILALPSMYLLDKGPGPMLFTILAVVFFLAVSAPSALYITSQKAVYNDWIKQVIHLPFLVIIGTGIAVSNSRAVLEAILGIESPFIRTPKKGDMGKKSYAVKHLWSISFEIVLGIYCMISLFFYLSSGKYLIGPFLFIYASGFLCSGFISIAHNR